jgi:transcriptional regulator of acetoin/glycerol metabolism
MSSRQIRQAREAFLSGEEAPPGVRSEILASWRRCELNGVNADRLVLPLSPDFDPRGSKLFLAAEPVLRRFAERLFDTHSSIVLADRRARVLGRWSGDRGLDKGLERVSVASGFSVAEDVAGTNGLGTALEEGRPAAIQGSEHFAEPFMSFTCVGSPIRHPITRRVEGGINIACRVKDTNSLVLPMVMEMASEIEHSLYLHAAERERVLFDTFWEEARSSAVPVVSMSEQLMMTNAAAARLLEGTDQVVLWEQAHQAVAQHAERSIVVTLADGRTVAAHCRPVELGGRSFGVVIHLDAALPDRLPTARLDTAAAPRGSALVGESRAWKDLEALVRRVSVTRLPLLFLGEPGTGKCALAHHAHQLSRVGDPWTVFDAALAKVDGPDDWLRAVRQRLECADGTVLLRHVAMLDPVAAGGLCAVLDAVGDDGPRLMATAMTDIPSEAGVFQSLFDRLGVVRISVPPLRQRPDDIRALAAALVRRNAMREPTPRLTPEALQALLRLDWPGNVRQLDNVIKGLLATGRRSDIQLEDLPEEVRRQTSRRPLSRLEQLELEQILVALRQADGNKLEAARTLGISRATLYRKLASFGVELDRSIF